MDILMIYGPSWDGPAQLSKHHLARYWSKSRRVLYVEYPLNPLSFFTRGRGIVRLFKRMISGPTHTADNLFIKSYFNVLPYHGGARALGGAWVNKTNQLVIAPRLKRTLKKLGFHNPVLFACSAHALHCIDHIPHSLLAYHCSDDYTVRAAGFPESFPRIEAEFIRRCDLVITTAEELRTSKISLNPNTHTVTNGADVAHFMRTQSPDVSIAQDMAFIPKPVIGYVGSIFQWIDQKMVTYAARQNPSWNFVFIGPIATDISEMRKYKNIHFLGPRAYKDIPSYLKGFDAAIVPFLFNEVTLKASPIKFYEYLAAGIPVVASNLPDLKPLSHVSYLVNSAEEFSRALDRAIADKSKNSMELRMKEAQNHSWEARFKKIDQLIDDALRDKAP